MKSCFECLWLEHLDLAKPDNMRVALGKVCDDKQEVEQVLAAAQTAEVKQALNDVTKHAFEQLGAFGCPWFWVRNGRGGGGPFFGSDRFHYMWDYLEIPHRDLALEASPAKL